MSRAENHSSCDSETILKEFPTMKHSLKLILGLALLATPGGFAPAKADDKVTPTPTPKKPAINLNSGRSNIYKEQTPLATPTPTPNKRSGYNTTRSNIQNLRTRGDKVTPSPTPKPIEATTVNGSRSNGDARVAASPSPTPKAK
jgi:hypothetical protein